MIIAGILLTFMWAGAATIYADIDESTDLFLDTIQKGELDRSKESTVIRSRFVKVNLQILPQSCKLDEGHSDYLELNLFDDVFLRAIVQRIDRNKNGSLSWTGRIEGVEKGQAILVYKDGLVAGNISVPGGFYQVRWAGSGIHAIYELDHSKFQPCANGGEETVPAAHAHSHTHVHDHGVEIPTEEGHSHALVQGEQETRDSNFTGIPAPGDPVLDDGSSIDVMVVYTADARATAGSTAAIEATINLAVTETNQGYDNSNVTQRLNLVHTAEVSYTETGSVYTDRNRLRDSSDGYIDEVHIMRDAYGADLVVLITENGGAYCGVAYIMTTVNVSFESYGFCVVTRSCSTGYYSFGHELGHIMSARHDYYVDSTNNSPYTYNHGYVSLPGDWRTIMAYNTDCSANGDGYCTRLDYWSNPAVDYGGLAMGIAEGNPNAADNHKTLDNTANTVANFRSGGTTPTLRITAPNGGETFEVGASETITWDAYGTVGNVMIEYSDDNGGGWTTETASTANDGSYSWTVPNAISAQCLVRISEASDNSPIDTSDAVFSIIAAVAPTITVTAPNGGESYEEDASTTITWDSTGIVGNVKIEYSDDNGGGWTTETASTANDGSYSWTIPNAVSTQCLVRISEAADDDPTDSSDAVFTITAAPVPTLTLNRPNGGEELAVGSTSNITWSTTGTVGDVSIHYSSNSGGSWTEETASTANDGTYAWTIPNEISTDCLVRIAEASDGIPNDRSDVEFSIVSASSPTLTLTSPDGGESLTSGDSHTVTWSSTGTVGNVELEYSTNSGGSWTTVIASTANDGSYNWTVPAVTSSTCLLRISEASDSDPTDTSDAVFSIAPVVTPEITVTWPNGGESFSVGSSTDIAWSSAGSVGNVEIEYSTNNGSSWSTISSSTSNDGSYSWTIPNAISTQCLVRIGEASDGSPSDTSNAEFTIVSASTPTLTLTSPNGGESLEVGASHSVTWYSTGSVGNVKIQYSSDNGISWSTVTSSTSNDGTYDWTLPNVESTTCLLRIKEASDGNPSDTSNAVFSISSPATMTVTSPNGAEELSVGSGHYITWTSTGPVGNVKIELSTDNGSNWSVLRASKTNNGSYYWNVPDSVSTQCLVRISEASDGNPVDTSDAVFSIVDPEPAATLTVLSPNGGEELEAGSTHTITWQNTGTVGNVKIKYSTDNGANWTTERASTANDGSYSWTVADTESTDCLVQISESSDGSPSDVSDAVFSIAAPDPAVISLNRNKFNFASEIAGATSDNEDLVISNTGGGTLAWTAGDDAAWLSLTPISGSGYSTLTVSVDSTGLAAGTYTGTITVNAADAANTPQTVAVTYKVYQSGSTSPPFGEFATPEEASTVSSSVPVTGWVIDDIGVESVKIYNGDSYVGDALLVEGARTDIEAAYPDYPGNYKAGWGYMLLTYFLPDGGNGTYTLSARATDREGNVVTLGSKTVTIDNNSATKPFGAIDTPAQGGAASGSSFRNGGWVLTPQPNMVPENGSTIDVYVDGVFLGNPVYGINRPDIASLFPGYANSNGAHAYFEFDTTAYSNGVHTIYWIATDNGGNADGVGSRFFTVGNAAGSAQNVNSLPGLQTGTKGFDLAVVPVELSKPVGVIKGYKKNATPKKVYPTKKGLIKIELKALERVVLDFGAQNGEGCLVYTRVGNQLRALPAGSTFDGKKGLLYWQPGPGFVGTYDLVLFSKDKNGGLKKTNLRIKITPGL